MNLKTCKVSGVEMINTPHEKAPNPAYVGFLSQVNISVYRYLILCI